MSEHTPGPLALVGSGEYTPAMNEIDRLLIEHLGGPQHVTVAVIPTASGLEPGMPESWNRRGVAHFRALGVEALDVRIVNRDDALSEHHAAMLRRANFFYFSGGNPQYITETLRDTPAWHAVVERHRSGAVLAGCSAGAMMLGGSTISVRQMINGGKPAWVPALNLEHWIATLPHFDRMASMITADIARAIVTSAPAGTTVVGVDEDTALVRLPARWQVLGRQGVTVFDSSGHATRYAAGDPVPLPHVAQSPDLGGGQHAPPLPEIDA